MIAALAFALAVPRDGLAGKVLCGYQGWFTTPADGQGLGWFHYVKNGKFEPGSSNVEYWPDVRELGRGERVDTPFTLRSGKPAQVYNAVDRTTTLRHFRWMRQYGIDGVFVQRFVSDLRGEASRKFRDAVLANCQAGAEANGRLFALMYDLSGLGPGDVAGVRDDWARIRAIVKSPAYLRQNGRPLVALWGVGFAGRDRRYSLAECDTLIDALKADGMAVMLGVPAYWRAGGRDATEDPARLGTFAKADVLSPWTVGRFGTDEEARRYANETLRGDLAWCGERRQTLMPVAFPGFSWHNMNPGSPLDQIPRRKGAFLRAQFDAYRAVGARTAYVAMFDEMDEGTAIFKLEPNPPAGFLDTEGLPSDFYLRLVGEETKAFRVKR